MVGLTTRDRAACGCTGAAPARVFARLEGGTVASSAFTDGLGHRERPWYREYFGEGRAKD